nr:immunoglobulin heavy chain junction region [Macaca mulatta]
CTSGHIAAAYW